MISRREIVERFIGEDLITFARRHDYDEEFIKLLSGEKVNSSYVPKSLQMKTDGRSIDQYHLNIGLSWVVEDYLVENSNGRYAKMGCDSKRTFLQKDITNEGDLKDLKTGRIIEVIQDHTGYIKKKGYANLRNEKLSHLNEQDAVILIVDLNDGTYFAKSSKKFNSFKIDSFAPFSGKPVHRIYMNKAVNYFKPIQELFRQFR